MSQKLIILILAKVEELFFFFIIELFDQGKSLTVVAICNAFSLGIITSVKLCISVLIRPPVSKII